MNESHSNIRTMDFADKKFQITWNESRLKDEKERYSLIGNRINFISIIYTVFAVFSISLFQFLIDDRQWSNFIFVVLFITFLFLFIVSVANAIRLLTPADVAFIEEPKIFYGELRDDYIEKGIIDDEVNDYLIESYLIQLQGALSHNITMNNRKSKYNYFAIRYALFALIPYSICVGIMLTNKPEKIQRIEIVNPNTKTMAKEKPKVSPAKIIVRPPLMIKENAEVREVKNVNIKGEKK